MLFKKGYKKMPEWLKIVLFGFTPMVIAFIALMLQRKYIKWYFKKANKESQE